MGKLINTLAKGAWSSATSYTLGDIVTYDGSSYICINNGKNHLPTDIVYWALLAQKGASGASGATGATGATGPMGSGATVDTDGTLAANSDAKVASQKAVKTYVDAQGAATGWITSADTFVYVSVTSFKIVGADRTAIYKPGTFVKFTNNSVTVYGIVASSAFSTDTTVTLMATSDYAINNSAITAPYYSYAANPQGFPKDFNIDPANFSGFASISGLSILAYSTSGRKITIFIDVTGTSDNVASVLTCPVACAVAMQLVQPITGTDNGTILTTAGIAGFASAATALLNFGKVFNSHGLNAYAGWTATGTKGIMGVFTYPF